MYAILITRTSQPVIAVLNDGTVPPIEDEATYFVFDNENVPNQIVSAAEFREMRETSNWFPMPDFTIWSKQ